MEIKTEYHDIREEGVDFPTPLGVMPDQMGINLCSMAGMSWSRLPDMQLVSVTVHFLPNFNNYIRQAASDCFNACAEQVVSKRFDSVPSVFKEFIHKYSAHLRERDGR